MEVIVSSTDKIDEVHAVLNRRKGMNELFDKLLSKIPGNGLKSVVGGLITAFPYAFPTLVEPLNATIQSVGAVILGIGLLHKAIKGLRK